MEKFIPYEKLSKKKKRELDARRRNVWQINPVTRKPADSRAYNRKKAQRREKDELTSVPFLFSGKRLRTGKNNLPVLQCQKTGEIQEDTPCCPKTRYCC